MAPLFEFSTRLAEHRVLCLLLENSHIANHHRRVQGAICNQLDTMEQIKQAAFAGFQICFQDHASEMWVESTSDVLDDANTLLDPFVALDEQGQEFQARKETGPKAAFLINEMFVSRRDALDNRFETKVCLRSSPKKSLLVRRFGLTFRQQEILRRTGPTFVFQGQLLGQGRIRVEVAWERPVGWSKMKGIALMNTFGPGGGARVAISGRKFMLDMW